MKWTGGAKLRAKLKTRSHPNQERASSEASMNFLRSCVFNGAKACFFREVIYASREVSTRLTAELALNGAESELSGRRFRRHFKLI